MNFHHCGKIPNTSNLEEMLKKNEYVFEASRSLGAGITGDHVGVEKPSQVLWKSSKCPQQQSHVSSPKQKMT